MSIFDSDESCGLTPEDYDKYYYTSPHKWAMDTAIGCVLPETNVGIEYLLRGQIFMLKLKASGLSDEEALKTLVVAITGESK